jgi:hypothetical protein
MYKVSPSGPEFRDLVEAKILEADRIYPPSQPKAKKAYVFGAIFALVDIPVLDEEQEKFVGQMLDDLVVPPLLALLRQLVQAVYDGLKRLLTKRRKKRWPKELAED